MDDGAFRKEAISPIHRKWDDAISRRKPIYHREDDIRSEFSRDYNRILHCTAYRRLKHKTQVFFATTNDHICTRIEHVNHVTAVSLTIANYLGLNTELTSSIAIGHDLGHAPFGHQGEETLKRIAEHELGETFWHEGNSLRFVDQLETLEDPSRREQNLNLTYAVRDGIVCHCGEVDENAIFPRRDFIDLNEIGKANENKPYTWEGCVVKVADKIAYLGRDIEDARNLRILTASQWSNLVRLIRGYKKSDSGKQINNTILIHDFIIDLCRHSSPDNGILFSAETLKFMMAVKEFNYENIYKNPRLNNFKRYSELLIESIFSSLKLLYKGQDTIPELQRYTKERIYPILTQTFCEWLQKYSKGQNRRELIAKYENDEIYDLNDKNDYLRATIDFISGMTDFFAIKVFNEITMF